MKAAEQELYRKYLAGELSGEELVGFEERLGEDMVFREDFELYREIEGFVEAKVEKGAALEVLRGVGRERGARVIISSNQNKSNYKKWLSIAALLFIGGAAAYFINANSVKEPVSYAEMYVEPTWPVERSGDGDALSAAVAEYLNGELESAVAKLKALGTNESMYWVAEIYAKQMQGDSVLKYMPVNFKDNIRRDRVIYLKIITLMNMGRHEEAKQELDALPLDVAEWYMEKIEIIFKH